MAHHEQHEAPEQKIATSPNWTITVTHGRTLKEGWHYETKVTASGSLITRSQFEDALKVAREMGETERDERNRRDSARNEGAS